MKLDVADTEPGMVLARPATNPQGQVLLKAGTEITPKHIRIFQSWGVTEVEVEGPSAEAAEDVPVTEQMEKVRARFRRAEDDPILGDLLEALLERVGDES